MQHEVKKIKGFSLLSLDQKLYFSADRWKRKII